MRLKSIVVLTALLTSASLTVPSVAGAERTKPPTDVSSAPDSWTDEELPIFELYGQVKQPRTAADEANLRSTAWGYRYVAGAGDNDVTVTEDGDRLLFHDRSISSWTNIPRRCVLVRVDVGRAASCTVPLRFAGGMFLEMWPRLGNDTVDTGSLPAQFRTWALVDAGTDLVSTGAGRDFINTAADRDVAHGGAGDDWIRMGRDGNTAYGDDGADKLVGGEDDDVLYGGAGADSLGGLAGDDVLDGGAGDDLMAGKVGYDAGYREGVDKFRNIDVVY